MSNPIKMVENGPPLEQEELSALERYIGVSLPSDYKVFLQEHNGGEPEEYLIKFMLPDKSSEAGDAVNFFLEVSDSVSYGLLNKYKNLSWQIPKGFIFIAISPGGNYFLIGINEKNYGQIFYKDHESEDEPYQEDGLPANMVKVANSFSEFMERLYDPDA